MKKAYKSFVRFIADSPSKRAILSLFRIVYEGERIYFEHPVLMEDKARKALFYFLSYIGDTDNGHGIVLRTDGKSHYPVYKDRMNHLLKINPKLGDMVKELKLKML